MSNSRSIRDPPVMTEPYEDWKNEVYAWSCYVETKTPPNKQGIALFLSLEGDARKAAAKVPLTDMKKDNGLDLVFVELDKFFLKDKDRIGFLAYDKFNAFRRPEGMAIKEFLIKFELLLNTCTTHGVELSEKIIAHQMLQSVNILPNKKELIMTTLDKFTPESMRNQILKLFCAEEVPSVANQLNEMAIKAEPHSSDEKPSYVMAGSQSNYNHSNRYNREKKHHNNFKKSHNSKHNRKDYRRHSKKNPVDAFGNITECDNCHSIFHYEKECPDKPEKRASYGKAHSSRHNL